ncbi:MAG: hypothetical protein K9I68_11715 [Bacteroidales bacterium]|nr:hypothetical protein [Bacteroidales bacterium]
MKFFLSKVTIIAFVLALLFSGCEKTEQPVNENNTGISEEDLKTEQKIKSFLNKMEQPTKSDETLTVEEAIWNIEAGLNYSYIDEPENMGHMLVDSAKIEIPVNNGQINMTDIAEAYDMFEDSLQDFYNSIEGDFNRYVTDIMEVQDLEKSNTVTLKATSLAGRLNPYSITDEDYWYWGWELGMCDSSGQGEGKDAADRLEQVANRNVSMPSNGDYVYPSSIEIHNFNPADVPDDDNPYGSSMLFEDYQEVTLNHHCLPPNEMSYYYNAFIEIGIDNEPSNKDVISYLLEDWTSYGDTGDPYYYDTWHMIHHAEITYGTWHTSSGGGDEQ